jgi:protein TonB
MKNAEKNIPGNNAGSPGKISEMRGYPVSDLHNVLEIKENRTSEQARNSRLFMSIGLCLSLILVISAFEYRFYDKGGVVTIGGNDSKFEETMEVPVTEQPPPPPPRIAPSEIVEVSDNTEIVDDDLLDLDVEMTEQQVVEQITYQVQTDGDIEEEETQEIFSIVEQQPEPEGGLSAFYEYIQRNLKYPAIARRNNIEGKVFVQFVVERDGRLTDVRVLKGIGGGCDEEAVRIISGAPKWQPGKQRGRPVRVQMILPIMFRLQM